MFITQPPCRQVSFRSGFQGNITHCVILDEESGITVKTLKDAMQHAGIQSCSDARCDVTANYVFINGSKVVDAARAFVLGNQALWQTFSIILERFG